LETVHHPGDRLVDQTIYRLRVEDHVAYLQTSTPGVTPDGHDIAHKAQLRRWRSRPVAGARPAWPRPQRNEGAAGNGDGTRASEAGGRDEQRPDVEYGVAAAVGGGAA
jgi:hypothetical protein